MKQSTIDRIRNTYHKDVVIGAYSYHVSDRTGKIERCKTEDIGRMWIDDDGHQSDAWEEVE